MGASEAFPGTPHRWPSSRRRRPRRCTAGADDEGPELMKKGRRTRCRAAHVEESLETQSGGNATGKAAAPWSPGPAAMLPAAGYFAPVSFTKPNRPSPQAGSEGGTGPTIAGHPGIRRRDPGKGPQDTPGPNRSDTRWWRWSAWKCPASGLEAMEGQGGEGPPRLGKEGGRSQKTLQVLKVCAHLASVYHD